MKPKYSIAAMAYYVKGLGYFNTYKEAQQAIDDNKVSATIICRVRPSTQRELEELAKKSGHSVSEVIRDIIERGLKNYGD